jgi:hypothetical protein
VNKILFVALLLLAGAALAQAPETSGTPPAAQRDSMEPGVNTSAPTAKPVAPIANGAASTDARPSVTPDKPVAPNKPAATAAAKKGNAKDRLDLESTQITGNRELPKVLYIVPWRSAQMGDLVGRPVNSLLDEVLEPVDRDVFRRQNRYFEALQPNEAAPAQKTEK